MVVLLDTNIILDVLQKREGLYDSSFNVFEKCAKGECSGFIAPHSMPNIFYIMRKVGVDVSDIRILLSGVLNIVAVSNLDEDDVRSAIEREDFKDFEDCLQDECAINIDADYIITRNTSDFRTSTINAITPEQLLDKMKD